MEADLDGDGKLSFEEFAQTVSNTVRIYPFTAFYPISWKLNTGYRQTNDVRRPILISTILPRPIVLLFQITSSSMLSQ